MITNIFLHIMAFLIGLPSHILASLSYSIPAKVVDSITFFFAQLHNIDFLVPMQTFMQVIGSYITFVLIWYTALIALWVYGLIRHGGNTKPHIDPYQARRK